MRNPLLIMKLEIKKFPFIVNPTSVNERVLMALYYKRCNPLLAIIFAISMASNLI